MYTKHNLLPIKITAPNQIKPELASVAFYGNRTIATDSFRLLEVSAFGEAHEPTLMLRDTLKTYKLKTYKTEKGQIKFTEKDIEEKTGHNLSEQATAPFGMYPDVDKIMSESPDEEYATIKVNGALFGELLSQMAKMNKFSMVEIKIPTQKKYSPIHVYTNSHKPHEAENQTAHGLMMPINGQ